MIKTEKETLRKLEETAAEQPGKRKRIALLKRLIELQDKECQEAIDEASGDPLALGTLKDVLEGLDYLAGNAAAAITDDDAEWEALTGHGARKN